MRDGWDLDIPLGITSTIDGIISLFRDGRHRKDWRESTMMSAPDIAHLNE